LTLFLGIDPGLSGALALLDTETGKITVRDVPVHELKRNGKTKREIDLYALARLMDDMAKGQGTCIVVEQVGSMPGQGVSSVFAFGKAYGILLGVAASTFCPIEFVTPQVWKRAMGVTASKDGSRAKASMLFPTYSASWARVKDDGRAEAVLIAAWAAEKNK
jgi:crossover junction endodeoxyribonuclease RuvC